jgi:hypothetical protein
MARLMDRRRPTAAVALLAAFVLSAGTPLALAGCSPTAGGSAPAFSDALTGPTGEVAPATGAARTPAPSTAPIGGTRPSDPPTPTPSPSAAPSPSPSARPTPTVGPTPALDPPPTSGPFAMDLYRAGDFATELKPIWCAPAALQTMINIMSSGADRSRRTQQLLHTIGRRLGPAPDKGSEPEGMARTLDSLGYGRFQVLALPTRSAAIKAAARAIRMTGRPAALLVWRGAHNWVMSGFRSTADPALTDDFRVTALRIEDVWYPRVSSIWGASRPPDTLVAVRRMPEDYLPWKRPTGRYPAKDGKFVLIIPVAGG